MRWGTISRLNWLIPSAALISSSTQVLPSSHCFHRSSDRRSTMAFKSFVEVKSDSHFSIHNLPYGVFKHAGGAITTNTSRPGVAIGDYVLDLSEIHSAGLFDGPLLSNSDCFHQVFVFAIWFYFIFHDYDLFYVNVLLFSLKFRISHLIFMRWIHLLSL